MFEYARTLVAPIKPVITFCPGFFILIVLTCLPLVSGADEEKNFDHFATGYPLSGVHIQVECAACHVKGVFKGTPRHCAECHNGQIASGKPLRHIRTPDLCDDCHTTFAWESATFDHSTISGACSRCHNGSLSSGKHNRHVLTNRECDECHITTAWLPAGFNHDDVTGACRTCHTDDLPREHVITSADCDACHLTTAWKPARFDHDAATGICSSCHSQDKPNIHFNTALQCDECHNNRSWQPARYDHAFFTVEHRSDIDCTRCHPSSNQNITWPFVGYENTCAGCHVDDFKAESHRKNKDDEVRYTVEELKDCDGACHKEGVPLGGHHTPSSGW